jgi:hypothetical protein
MQPREFDSHIGAAMPWPSVAHDQQLDKMLRAVSRSLGEAKIGSVGVNE